MPSTNKGFRPRSLPGASRSTRSPRRRATVRPTVSRPVFQIRRGSDRYRVGDVRLPRPALLVSMQVLRHLIGALERAGIGLRVVSTQRLDDGVEFGVSVTRPGEPREAATKTTGFAYLRSAGDLGLGGGGNVLRHVHLPSPRNTSVRAGELASFASALALGLVSLARLHACEFPKLLRRCGRCRGGGACCCTGALCGIIPSAISGAISGAVLAGGSGFRRLLAASLNASREGFHFRLLPLELGKDRRSDEDRGVRSRRQQPGRQQVERAGAECPAPTMMIRGRAGRPARY